MKFMITTSLLFLIPLLLNSQITETIDLGTFAPGSTREVYVSADKEITIFLKNYIDADYIYEFNRTYFEYDTILTVGTQGGTDDDECTLTYKEFRNECIKKSSEKEYALCVEDKAKQMSEDCIYRKEILNFRTKDIVRFTLRKGESYTIVVKRGSLTWTLTLKTRPPGKWGVQYGFSFLTNSISEHERYYLKQEDGGNFSLTKERGTPNFTLDFVPTIMFQWYPHYDRDRNFATALQAGLGLNPNDPSVFLGGALLYRQNISISAGLAFTRKTRLLGKYQEGEILSNYLEFDQLHERIYRPDLFFSINFRFGSNPFNRAKENTESEESE